MGITWNGIYCHEKVKFINWKKQVQRVCTVWSNFGLKIHLSSDMYRKYPKRTYSKVLADVITEW